MGWLKKIDKWVWTIFLVVAFVLLYYSSGYFFVYNNDAYVHADIVKVSTGVEGIIDEVHVKDNQFVKKGDLILTLDQQPFTYNRGAASASLEKAEAEYNLLKTQKAEAEAQIRIATSQNNLAELEFNRYKKLLEDGVIAQNDFDERKEQYAVTQAELEKAEKTLENIEAQEPVYAAEIRQWRNTLGLANYNQTISRVFAKEDGYINNLRVYPGDYANLGDTLFGYVNADTTYIIANIKESNLPLMRPGKHVWVYLSNYPWKIYRGKVESLARAVSRTATESNPAVPYVEPITSWIRYDYRIPVRIHLLDFPADEPLYIGVDARIVAF